MTFGFSSFLSWTVCLVLSLAMLTYRLLGLGFYGYAGTSAPGSWLGELWDWALVVLLLLPILGAIAASTRHWQESTAINNAILATFVFAIFASTFIWVKSHYFMTRQEAASILNRINAVSDVTANFTATHSKLISSVLPIFDQNGGFRGEYLDGLKALRKLQKNAQGPVKIRTSSGTWIFLLEQNSPTSDVEVPPVIIEAEELAALGGNRFVLARIYNAFLPLVLAS